MSTQTQTDDPDSLSQRIASEWLQPDLCVRSDLTEEPAWLEISDSNERSAASVWAYDDEEEITLQTKRAVDEELEQLTEDIVYGSSEVTLQPGRILDDSYVPPCEAPPFEPLSVDEQIEQATVERRDEEELRVEEWGLIDATHGTPLLDESQVLSSEASFATVMSDESRGAYSPLSEFLVKTNLNLTQLMLASLLLVLAIAVATLLLLLIMGGEDVHNSTVTENKASQTLTVEANPASAETKSVPPSSSLKSVAVSKPKEQLRENADLTGDEKAKLNATSEKERRTFPENSSSDGVRSVPSRQTESRTSVKASPQNAKSIVSRSANGDGSKRHAASARKKVSASVKEPLIVRRAAVSKRSEVRNSRSETVVAKRESKSSSTEVATTPRDESKIPPSSGGGQRPRKVTP